MTPTRLLSLPCPQGPVEGLDHRTTIAWHLRCEALRANPGIQVFVAGGRHTEHPDCSESLLMALGCDESIQTELSYCLTCRRVGVFWPIQWPIPDDLRSLLEPAVHAQT